MRGRMMAGCGERRRRDERGKGDGGKNLSHITSPADDYRPELGVEADCSFLPYRHNGDANAVDI